MEEVWQEVGIGKFQYCLFAIAGLGFAADSIEVGVITFLEYESKEHFTGAMACEIWQVSFLGTIIFCGQLCSGLLWGPLSDRIGRKKAFIWSNFVLVVFGVASAFAPSFWSLAACRGLVGFAIGGIVVPFDILLESVPQQHVPMVGFAMEFFWTGGTLFVAGCAGLLLNGDEKAYRFESWRVFVLLTALPVALSFVSSLFILESPAFLSEVGRDEEAMEVLRKAGEFNGVKLPADICLSHRKLQSPSFSEIFGPRFCRQTLILAILWVLSIFGYYGASFANAQLFSDAGKLDIADIMFSSSGEVLAVVTALFLISREVQLMPIMSLFFAIATLGGSMLSGVLFFEINVAASVLGAIAFLLRIGSMGGSCGVWLVTPLAYPTYITSTAHGFHFAMSRSGGLFATLFPVTTPGWVRMLSFATAHSVCLVVSLFDLPLKSKEKIGGSVDVVSSVRNLDFGEIAD